STGAAKAVGQVLPELNGKLNGMAVRVPVPDGSVTDLVAELDKNVTEEEVNAAFKKAADNELKGIMEYSEDPLVSKDIVGNPHSSIVDGLSTMVMEDNMVKVVSWYDNEMGYSSRCVDLVQFLGEQGFSYVKDNWLFIWIGCEANFSPYKRCNNLLIYVIKENLSYNRNIIIILTLMPGGNFSDNVIRTRY